MNNRYGILVSGNLGYICLLEIAKICKIEFIFTDSKSNQIIEFADFNLIPIFIGNPRNGKALSFLQNKKVDFLISINYLFIIENDLINFPLKLAINIHGSLLPKYRGRTPHIWSIINNESITGITAHQLTEICDQGDILYQESIQIENQMTGNDLLEKYKKKYPKFIFKVVEMLETNKFKLVKQDENIATWFSKRTPEDGQIVWSWQKERLYNWVRALSFPYPGAFTYYDGEVVIIDKVEYSDTGFVQEVENGTILVGGPQPIVKTPNGAIKILNIRNNSKLFSKGNLFYERH